jgi:hypothetical protein
MNTQAPKCISNSTILSAAGQANNLFTGFDLLLDNSTLIIDVMFNSRPYSKYKIQMGVWTHVAVQVIMPYDY